VSGCPLVVELLSPMLQATNVVNASAPSAAAPLPVSFFIKAVSIRYPLPIRASSAGGAGSPSSASGANRQQTKRMGPLFTLVHSAGVKYGEIGVTLFTKRLREIT
jgi:hypothetical protein